MPHIRIREEHVEVFGHGLAGRTWSKGSALVLHFDDDGRAVVRRAVVDELDIGAHPELSLGEPVFVEFTANLELVDVVLGPYQEAIVDVPAETPKPKAKAAAKPKPVKAATPVSKPAPAAKTKPKAAAK